MYQIFPYHFVHPAVIKAKFLLLDTCVDECVSFSHVICDLVHQAVKVAQVLLPDTCGDACTCV